MPAASSARARRHRSCRIRTCRRPTLALELKIRDVEAGYGAVRALHGISVSIEEKETVALLGTNGNGKSTLMKCVMGIVRRPTGGGLWAFDGAATNLRRPPTEGFGI